MKFFKKSLTVVSALAMTMSLAACGGSASKASGSTASGEASTTFTYAIGGEPDYIDPAHAGDSVTAAVFNQVFYPLFSIGENGETVNEACKKYEVSEDGLVYTFHLIDGLKWSDGQDCTAGDYVYGIKRAVGMGSADASYSYYLADWVKNAKKYNDACADVADMTDIGVEEVDDKTFTITLEQPCPYFVSMMTAGVFYALRPDFAPEHDYTWAGKPGYPTNGAFVPTEIDAATEIVMTKNPEFVYADQVKVDTLVCKTISDMNAEMQAYNTGEIDMATSVDDSVTKVFEGKDDLLLTDSVINYYVMINSGDMEENAALKDARVRQALSYAIDREAVVSALDAGDAYYALYGFVPTGVPDTAGGDFRENGGDLTKYDPEAAKELLAEAGYADGLSFTYYYNSNTMHDTVAQVLQQQWAAIGVNVTLKTGEIRSFFDDRSNGIFDLARGAFSADYMDPATYLDLGYSSSQTVVSWGDATYDELVEKSRTLLDTTERSEALHDAEKYLVEDMAYTIPVFGYKTKYLVNPNTTGIVYSPQGGFCLWYVGLTK